MKQVAYYNEYFFLEGSELSFRAGFGMLVLACKAAANVILEAQINYAESITLHSGRDPQWNAELREQEKRLRLELMLTLNASHDWLGSEKVRAKSGPGSFWYTTASGLQFGWRRGPEFRGYAFFVIHPTGRFEEDSTLLASLKKHNWTIGSPVPDEELQGV